MTRYVIAALCAIAVLSLAAAEDRMSRHDDNFPLHNAAQLRRFCRDNPKDPKCRHADQPVELNVVGRTTDGNETILVPDALVSDIPSLSPSSRLTTFSPTPPKSSPPSILPSRDPTIFPTTGIPLTESPSRYESASPSLEPSLAISISPSAPETSFPSQEPSLAISISPSASETSFPSQIPMFPSLEPSLTETAPPKGLYTSFPSQIPTFSPSIIGSGPSAIPDMCTPDPNGDFGIKTKVEVLVEYFYEIQYDPSIFDPVPDELIFRIERKIAQALIGLLFGMECVTMQRIGNDAAFAGKRGLQNEFNIMGLSYRPPDMVIPVTCSGIPEIPTTLCSLVEGGITLYIDESLEVTEGQGVAILLEIENTINNGEISSSEPGILLTIYVSGEIKTTTLNDPTAKPIAAPTRRPREPTQSPTMLLPTEEPTVGGTRKFPIYLYVILIGLLPLLLWVAFFLFSRRKRQRNSHHSVSEDGPGGARGRRRLHLMSIPTRDSEHSLSLNRASLGPSLSRSDSGSFASLIRIPRGDEELKLRPTTTGSIA